MLHLALGTTLVLMGMPLVASAATVSLFTGGDVGGGPESEGQFLYGLGAGNLSGDGVPATGGVPQPSIQLHPVPAPINSYRLLAMSMDDDGYIWTGSIHGQLHRYDPRTGSIETKSMPAGANVLSASIAADEKVDQ